MHGGTVFGIDLPAHLYDPPQFRAYLERPIEYAVTMGNDFSDAVAVMITVVRALAGKHLHLAS
jgi:hypothetical protein